MEMRFSIGSDNLGIKQKEAKAGDALGYVRYLNES
jgi:hypothetical protein